MGARDVANCMLVLVLMIMCRNTDSVDLPRFVGKGSNVTAAAGRDAALTCRVDNLQNYKVAWLRVDTQTILSIAGHVITKNHRVGVTQGEGAWTLILRAVTPADGGRYMCQINTEPMMSQTHLLQVVVPPDISDAASSGEVSVEEGSAVALRCVASGTPAPALTWRREDARHIRLDNHTFASKWSGEWLNMSAALRGAGGAYLCIASNGVPPSVSKRVLLHVLFLPAVRATRAAVRVAAGGAAALHCSVEAHPTPRLYWTLDGHTRLTNGSKYTITTSSRGYRYTMTLVVGGIGSGSGSAGVSRADAGAYRCHADNTLGQAHAELLLLILTTTTTTTTTTSTTTTTTTTTTTPRPSSSTTVSTTEQFITLDSIHDSERRAVASFGASAQDPFVILGHQMQNLEMGTTM